MKNGDDASLCWVLPLQVPPEGKFAERKQFVVPLGCLSGDERVKRACEEFSDFAINHASERLNFPESFATNGLT